MGRGIKAFLALPIFLEVLGGEEVRTDGGGDALEEAAAVLKHAQADLRARLEEILDRRTRSLLQSQEGFAPELRRMLSRARRSARLDLLIGVSKRGSQPARFILPSDGLSVRVLLEEDPAARALVEALAFGGVRPPEHSRGESKGDRAEGAHPPGSTPDLLEGIAFAVLPEAFFQELVAAPDEEEEEPEQPALVLFHAVSSASGAALLGGIRLSTLGDAIQKVLDEKWGPVGARWSAFLAWKPAGAKGTPSAGSEPRIVAGDGQGFSVPEDLASAIFKDGRVIRREPERSWRGRAARPGSSREEWMVLRDRDGLALGGIGIRFPQAAPAGGEALGAGKAKDSDRLAAWAAVGSLGVLVALGLTALILLLREGRSRRSHRRSRALAQAREELSSELRTAAQKLSDPILMGPLLERAFEKAVGRSGESLACAIGERIAASIASRIPRPEEFVKPSVAKEEPTGAKSGAEVVSRAVLGESFPLALLAVDGKLEVIAWNPAAERLWGAAASERIGKSLEELDFFGIEGEMRGRARRAMETGVVEPPVRLSFDRDRVHHIQLTVVPLFSGAPADPEPEGGRAAGADARGLLPEGALLIAENVSEKIEHEIAAKILGQYQKALSASLPLPMVVVDADGRVMSWNAAAENLFGVPEREALGKEFSSIPPTSVESSALPFCTPDGTQRGTLYLYGKGVRTLDLTDLDLAAEEAAKGVPAKAEPAKGGPASAKPAAKTVAKEPAAAAGK